MTKQKERKAGPEDPLRGGSAETRERRSIREGVLMRLEDREHEQEKCILRTG